MPITRHQLLGWIEHCERAHPGVATNIPTWLCTMDAVRDAVESGHIMETGFQFLGARIGMGSIYSLTDKGRQEFYADLPRRS